MLRRKYSAEAHIMLRMGLFLAAVLVPVQIFFGHLTGDYVHDYQPVKFAAIEGRWHRLGENSNGWLRRAAFDRGGGGHDRLACDSAG
jgi:cytochrome bd-type quinol oxidase subunit 1